MNSINVESGWDRVQVHIEDHADGSKAIVISQANYDRTGLFVQVKGREQVEQMMRALAQATSEIFPDLKNTLFERTREMQITDNTLAAARQVGRWLSVLQPEHATDSAIADQVAFACEVHESEDPDAVQKIGRWLAKEITAIRADGEGTFLHDLAEEITAAIREARVAQAEAEKPEEMN